MWCVVSDCYNVSSQTPQRITYHLFPSEPSLRAAWLEALHIGGWDPEENSAVCSEHFLQEDLLVGSGGKRVVRAGAVPIGDLRACRICFVTDCKLYSMTGHDSLYKAYENLTELSLKTEDTLPMYLCTECACKLLTYLHFRNTSLRAHLMLLAIVKRHGYVTLELIQSAKEQSSLGFEEINCDLDFELAKLDNIYTNKQANIKPDLAENVDIECVKNKKNDVINKVIVNHEDTTFNDDMDTNEQADIKPVLCSELNIGCIKAEKSDVNNQVIVIRKDTINDDMDTNEQADIKPVLFDKLDIGCIKAENNDVDNQNIIDLEDIVNDDIDTNKQAYIIPDSCEEVVINCIKAETNSAINHDIVNLENTSNCDMYTNKHADVKPNLRKEVEIDCIKVENSDVINQNFVVPEDISNYMESVSCLHENITDVDVKIEKHCDVMVQDGVNVDSSKVDMKEGDQFVDLTCTPKISPVHLTSKVSHKKHRYSVPKKLRRKVQATLRKYHGYESNLEQVRRKNDKKVEQRQEDQDNSHAIEGRPKLKTYARSRPIICPDTASFCNTTKSLIVNPNSMDSNRPPPDPDNDASVSISQL